MRTETPWGPWDPPPLAEAVRLLTALRSPWWIAGGYAVELAVGRAFRDHGDIDVLVPRDAQAEVRRVLPGWDWWAADPPGTLRPWHPGETLPAAVHDLWCRPGPDEPWRLQFMLDEVAGGDWVYRRDPRVRLPLARLGRVSDEGIPYLAPEVQLLYKSRSRRPKDERDFEEALPALDDHARAWLTETITLTESAAHPWAARLRALPAG
ncbi:nucleotidyltransferase domain-containing protein [Streptomyces sp. NBC_00525]|uniref:nucleotidyltransferase domain-containing protein n=1 Tax=Streptomyces sp. NBC_00525 TaxID=2903660 RepID=UPI002E815D29|nr:amino acid transporter [Streptomyces sp. NBC_00525]WUC95926.1 amino acid transporter [Streptomyces sp. NBC_00525]